MTRGETELEMIPFVEGGELMMLWQLHREGLGSAVEITTSELTLSTLSWHPSVRTSQPRARLPLQPLVKRLPAALTTHHIRAPCA